MAKGKTLEQIFCESYFGIECWKSRSRLEQLAWARAVAAVEAEVLRRLESEGRLGTPIKELRKALGKAKH